MGQTCQTVDLHTNRAMLGLQNSLPSQHKNRRQLIKEYVGRQGKNIKSITLIQNSQELIYQYNDTSETVEKLRVGNWQNSQVYEHFTIQDFIDDRSFVVRVKVAGRNHYTWKLISAIRVDNMSSLMDVGLAYYNLARVKRLCQISDSFVYAEKCWVQLWEGKKSGTFIIESQEFEEDVIGLKQLGRFMRRNGIQWQDKQFAHIVQQCSSKLQTMHDNNFVVVEEIMIAQSGSVYCVGMLQESVQLSGRKGQDFFELGVYLLETLYGRCEDAGLVEELQHVIRQEEEQCKFKHVQSIQLLTSLLKAKQPTKLTIPQPQSPNIASYIESYRAKTTIQPSLTLAERYIELKEYPKAKEILFERLSLLMYQQKGQVDRQSLNSNVFNRLMKKLNLSKSQQEECFDVLEHIIRLERKIAKQDSRGNELDALVREYVSLGISLSFNSRKQSNFSKSLSILQRAHEFLGEENDSWLLNLHIADCCLSAGRLDDAQQFYSSSIKFEINQANVCFFIKFYSSVLNWQKAISLLRSYEGLIADDYLYDLLIAKILLSKALCISPQFQEGESQRVQTLCESLAIGKRVLDRRGIPQFVLCEAYELIGDANFYLRDNEKAFEAYEKGLALVRSIQFSKKAEKDCEQSKYGPGFMQKSQLSFSRSVSPHSVQNSIYRRSASQKSGGNQTHMSMGTSVSQAQQKQSSYITQLKLLYNFDKKSILLSSMANCRFIQKKYAQAIQLYEEARKSVFSHNVDLKNSIVGNMAVCSMEMGKRERDEEVRKSKVEEGKALLEHVINVTRKQTPSKLENDVNYVFLVNELEAL